MSDDETPFVLEQGRTTHNQPRPIPKRHSLGSVLLDASRYCNAKNPWVTFAFCGDDVVIELVVVHRGRIKRERLSVSIEAFEADRHDLIEQEMQLLFVRMNDRIKEDKPKRQAKAKTATAV